MGINLSVTIQTCKHAITEVEGENVCLQCGRVVGYSEVESFADWNSHNVGTFGHSETYKLILQVIQNLHLPSYAMQTILTTTIKLRKMGITKKQAILYSTVYSCRIHNIPRLLSDIFSEIEKSSGKNTWHSENSLLRLLNKTSKKIVNYEYAISPPNKEYYLQAYLAKIQRHVVNETNEKYFEIIRTRSHKLIKFMHSDPSTAAKEAIFQSMSSVMRTKVTKVLSC